MPLYACDVKSPSDFYSRQEGEKPKLWEWWAVGAVKARAAKKAEARKAARTAEARHRLQAWDADAFAQEHARRGERFNRMADAAMEVFGADTASPLSTRVPMDWDKDVPIDDGNLADEFMDKHPTELTTLIKRLPTPHQAKLADLASIEAGSIISAAQLKAALDSPEPPTPPTAFLKACKKAGCKPSPKIGEWLDREAGKAFTYTKQLDRHFSRLDEREHIHAEHGATLEAAVKKLEPLTEYNADILPMITFSEKEIGKKARDIAATHALRGQIKSRCRKPNHTVNFLDQNDFLMAMLEMGSSISAALSRPNIIPDTDYRHIAFPHTPTTEWTRDHEEREQATTEEIEQTKRESPKHWRRHLRREIARAEAHIASILRMTGRHSPFVSTYALTGWRSMGERTRKWMNGKELESEGGERLSLAEILSHSKEARRSQLVAMVNGMAEYGKSKGYRGVFLSPTLPPEWHPNPAMGGNSYNPHLSPAMANKELSRRWHCVMAAAHEAGLDFFGVQVKEAHMDGCPHLHAFLWVKPEDMGELIRHARRHFPGEHACKVKLVNDEEGTAKATSYVLTYVLKTLGDGVNAAKTDDGEAEADKRDDGGDRHAAWASRNGIRRFSIVGLPKGLIGKWKAIHRTLRQEDHPADLDPTFHAIRRAMKKGQWKRALILLGAFSKGDRLTTRREERTNCWGGTYTAAVAIVNPRTGNEILLRPVRWQLVDKKDETESGLSIVPSFPREASDTTWIEIDDIPAWEPPPEGVSPYWDEELDGVFQPMP